MASRQGPVEKTMRAQDYSIAQEVADDWWEVEALYDLCFAPGRTALSSYRLRDGVEPIADLCLVARDSDGVLAGAVRNWPIRVGDEAGMLLGPIAVHPTRQGEGLAGQLMRKCLVMARQLGWQRVLLVGDAPYYSKFGFTKLPNIKMPPPTNPDRVLGLSLTANGWTGVEGTVSKAGD